jgi:hypothetical protein
MRQPFINIGARHGEKQNPVSARIQLATIAYWGRQERRAASGKNPLAAALLLSRKIIQTGRHVVSDTLNCFPAVTDNR